MPFWSDKRENFKAKLEHKMCIAKESPDSGFDLSDCNLSEIPSGVFSMCRVFLKESLVLENNNICNLLTGGSLKDLSHLLVLNLKCNKFSSLPEQISFLTNLQVLNLESNHLKMLPLSIEKLDKLQHLNLKNNRLANFPLPVCSLQRLQFLNLCDNPKIKSLPNELCNLLLLSELNIDMSHLVYPSQDVCLGGTECIIKFLCSEMGKEYCPPVDVILDTQTEDIPANQPNTLDFSASYLQYQRTKERRQQELVSMEETLKENYAVQSRISADSNLRRKKLLDDIVQEQGRMEDEIILLQNKKDLEKKILIGFLLNVEDHSAKLIDQLIGINNKRKHVEEMSVMLEMDRIENEELFCVKQEELEQLRKKEILEAMTKMLQQEETRGQYQDDKSCVMERVQNDENESNLKLHNIFQERELDQQILVNRMLEEEQFQKEAFEVLQLQRDIQHQEIAHQIRLIERELTDLTSAEIKKQDLKLNTEVNVLADHRMALACLLTELLTAREEREKELKERLHQMEAKRVQEMEDFWLIQYQKLLDRKPKGIITSESGMDVYVRDILLEVPAVELLPLFASKGVTFSELLTFTNKDLKKIGVVDEDVCQAILSKTREFYKRNTYQPEELLPAHKASPESPTDVSDPEPSAPPEPEEPIELLEPTAPAFFPDAETKLWCQTECVVCMDTQASAVFLPCGHVCCCQTCSSQMELCPMCRTTIGSKFILSMS